jgi:hypothetical protein
MASQKGVARKQSLDHRDDGGLGIEPNPESCIKVL